MSTEKTVQKIGRYEIIGELGKGAMGQVYKAVDPNIGREVALKTMRMDVHGMENEEMLKRFKNEARAAGVLNHPNIVTIYDAGDVDGLFYIAMEFVDGEMLHSQMAEQRQLPTDRVIQISRDICAGLDYAHSKGVIHRDVKPANMMITSSGVTKIMDFGIAKAGGGMTSTGQVLGTPNYMSPEQVKGKELDGRSDLFSFGVMLYEMVTGEKPFAGQNVTTIIYKIVNENPVPPRELDVTIHPGLSAVIEKSLQKDPAMRYQTGADLVKDLENFRAGGASDATTVMSAGGEATTVMGATASMTATRPMSTGSGTAAMPAMTQGVRTASPIQSSMGLRLAPAAEKKSNTGMIVGVLVLLVALAGGGFWWMQQQEQPADNPVAKGPTTPATGGDKPSPVQPGATTATSTTPSTAASTVPTTTIPTTNPGTSSTTAGGMGLLVIHSNVPDATLTIDGEQVSLPFNRRVEAGQYRIQLVKRGYAPYSQTVNVTPNGTSDITANLVASSARMLITSTPAGAAISVDGRPTGQITPATVETSPGSHQVTLTLQGYKDFTTSASASAGDEARVSGTLQRAQSTSLTAGCSDIKGTFDVSTTPPGATIVMLGRSAPKPTPFKFESPSNCDLTMELKLEGYQTLKKTVRAIPGKTVKINETLVPQ